MIEIIIKVDFHDVRLLRTLEGALLRYEQFVYIFFLLVLKESSIF